MPFGSEILVKRHGGVFAWTSLGAGVLLLLVAAFFLSPGWRAPFGAVLFGTFGLIFSLGGLVLVMTVFEFYEAGFVCRSLFGSSQFLYQDLLGFTFAEEQRHVKFVIPSGTAVEIEFLTPARKVLRLHAASVFRPTDLYSLRDRIATAMRERLLSEIASGQAVDWAGSRLSAHEVRVEHDGWLSGPVTATIPIRPDTRFELRERSLALFLPGEGSGFELPKGALNFYPGFEAFKRLVATAA